MGQVAVGVVRGFLSEACAANTLDGDNMKTSANASEGRGT
jgi:hypothetical protein